MKYLCFIAIFAAVLTPAGAKRQCITVVGEIDCPLPFTYPHARVYAYDSDAIELPWDSEFLKKLMKFVNKDDVLG
jgi:hypothetical protein